MIVTEKTVDINTLEREIFEICCEMGRAMFRAALESYDADLQEKFDHVERTSVRSFALTCYGKGDCNVQHKTFSPVWFGDCAFHTIDRLCFKSSRWWYILVFANIGNVVLQWARINPGKLEPKFAGNRRYRRLSPGRRFAALRVDANWTGGLSKWEYDPRISSIS